jgi:beta-1,4-N-acetylglucosaminyltransferase
MIFVTTGNYLAFPRLIAAVERLKREGHIHENVLLQIGNMPGFFSEACTSVDFLSPDEFSAAVNRARIVISHAGAGAVIHVLGAGKVPVVMPRRKKYGEHVDDHQLDLARVLAAERRAIVALEADDLPLAIASASTIDAAPPADQPMKMIRLVANAIDEILLLKSAARSS